MTTRFGLLVVFEKSEINCLILLFSDEEEAVARSRLRVEAIPWRFEIVITPSLLIVEKCLFNEKLLATTKKQSAKG